MHVQLLPQYTITSFKPSNFFGEAHFVFLLLFVYECGKESLCVFDIGARAYFRSTMRIFNFGIAILVFLVFVTQIAIMDQIGRFSFDPSSDTPFSGMLEADNTFDEASVLVFSVRAQKFIMAWLVVLSLLRTVSLLSGVHSHTFVHVRSCVR